MSNIKIKPKYWWSPKARKQAKLMQLILDYKQPEIEKAVSEKMKDYFIYGIKPTTNQHNGR